MDGDMKVSSGERGATYNVGARFLPLDVERSKGRGERSEIVMNCQDSGLQIDD
jgi:hypothetical protein